MKEEKKWYVVYTKSKLERRVAEILGKKHIPVYLPEYKQLQQMHGRQKTIKKLLLPSLLFAFLSEQEVKKIMEINGVAGILYKLQNPAIVKYKEIDVMQRFLAEHHDVIVEKVPIGTYSEDYSLQSGIFDNIYSNIPYEIEKVYLPSLGYSLHAKTTKAFITNVA